MIYPAFYKRENLRPTYLEKNVPHYPIKRRVKIVGKYEYTIKTGESLFDISKAIFGEDYPHYWTYISELNPTRHPDQWIVGETIFLPKIIIQDTEGNISNFTDAEITSTSI